MMSWISYNILPLLANKHYFLLAYILAMIYDCVMVLVNFSTKVFYLILRLC